MAVAPGEQRCTRRRADGRDVEAVVLDAALGHPGVVGRLDGAAECARVAEAGIVDQHEQDVWRTVGRRRVPDEIPVRLRSRQRPVDLPGEGWTANGQMASIHDGHDCDLLHGRLDPGPSHQGTSVQRPLRRGMDPIPRVSGPTERGHHPIDLKPRVPWVIRGRLSTVAADVSPPCRRYGHAEGTTAPLPRLLRRRHQSCEERET